MLRGEVTVATYCIGEDGLTVQCAFDFDNHKKTNPSLPRVSAAVDHIKEIGAQPIVIASGSPDSFHIHVPILRTAIETSHDFMKTLHNELKQSHKDLDFKNDTETFPKQTKASRKKFGNALKIPGAVQRKSGKRSQLLDPYTKQPVDVIFITKVLELRQPEEEAVKVGVRQYLPSKKPRTAKASTRRSRQHSSAPSQPARISEMRPCILAAVNKRLEGNAGNDMRVAIVCEALAAGKTRDEIIALFEGQDDFDPTKTAYYVDYIIERGYMHWKCETIQEKCSTLVACEGCPLREKMSGGDPEITVEPAVVR